MDKISNREYCYFEFTYNDLEKLIMINMLDEVELYMIHRDLKHLIHLEKLYDRCYGHLTDEEKYDLEIEGLIDWKGFGWPWRLRIIFDKEHHHKIISHCFLTNLGINLTDKQTPFTTYGKLELIDLDLRKESCMTKAQMKELLNIFENLE